MTNLVTTSEDATCVGLMWQLHNVGATPREELHRQLKDQVVTYAMEHGSKRDDDGKFPVELTMPCGHSKTFDDIEDVPFESISCTCGNPNHWFVKYKEW